MKPTNRKAPPLTQARRLEIAMARLTHLLEHLYPAIVAAIGSQHKVQRALRQQMYGTATHLVPRGEAGRHIAHPLCLCEPKKEDPEDGPTRFVHRRMN